MRSSDVVRWRAAITIFFALGGITLSTWGPRLPAIADDLRLRPGGLGLLLSGVTVGSVLGLLLAAPVLRRLGSRPTIAAVLACVAAGLVAVGASADLLHSTPLIAIGFVLVGLAIGALDVVINVEGAALESATGRTLMPSLHAAWSGGAAIGSGIGAACAGLGIPPSGQFTAEAALVAVSAVIGRVPLSGGVSRFR